MGLDPRFEEPALASIGREDLDLDVLDSRQSAQKARVQYLVMSFSIVSVNLAAGFLVYRVTNSITMKLDLLHCCSDVVGLIVNMIVEVMKGRTTDSSRRFKLDLIGCVVSMVFLIAVTAWGFVGAIRRSKQASKPFPSSEDEGPDHVMLLFIFSLFSCILALLTGGTFWKSFSDMYPDGYAEDRLNTISSLAHTCVDVVGNGVVLVTSLSMVLKDWSNSKSWTKFQEMARSDVFGSYVIVFVTAMLVLFVFLEAWKSTRMVEEEVEKAGAAQDVAQPVLASSYGQEGYGSTESNANVIGERGSSRSPQV